MRRSAGSMLAAAAVAFALLGCERASTPVPAPLDPPDPAAEATGDACPERRVADAVAVLFTRDGICLPGDQIVLYRCSPGDEPVLRLGSGSGAVAFLGGTYAVPTQTLPANVRFAGSADGMEVLISDPVPPSPTPTPTVIASPTASPVAEHEPEPLVYFRHEGVTERWLRLVRRRTVHEPPIAWLIGDSILDGGRDAVELAFEDWSMTLDAEVGRPSSSGIPLAREAAAGDADVVLMELGTNDSSVSDFRSHLIETLEHLGGVPLVLWQTARGPAEDPRIASVNAAIRDTAPDYPNVSIADWEAFVPPEAVETDGIHPDPGFEDLESELLEPVLQGWREAMTGDGALACGPRVVRATA